MTKMVWKLVYVFSFLVGLFFAAKAEAAPFLLTDIADVTTVTTCTATIDVMAPKAGQVVAAGYTAPAGVCAVDLAGMTNGIHTVKVTYANVWGEAVGGPFTFAKKLPETPSGARIVGTISQ